MEYIGLLDYEGGRLREDAACDLPSVLRGKKMSLHRLDGVLCSLVSEATTQALSAGLLRFFKEYNHYTSSKYSICISQIPVVGEGEQLDGEMAQYRALSIIVLAGEQNAKRRIGVLVMVSTDGIEYNYLLEHTELSDGIKEWIRREFTAQIREVGLSSYHLSRVFESYLNRIPRSSQRADAEIRLVYSLLSLVPPDQGLSEVRLSLPFQTIHRLIEDSEHDDDHSSRVIEYLEKQFSKSFHFQLDQIPLTKICTPEFQISVPGTVRFGASSNPILLIKEINQLLN